MITFKVTKKDIHKGNCGDTKKCAIALALSRKVKKRVNVSCGHYIEINNKVYTGITHREIDRIGEFINTFDEDKIIDGKAIYPKKVKPVTFRIKRAED